MAELWRDELTDAALRDDLDRQHPERLKLRPTDVEGLREAFVVVEDLWAPTIARARLSPEGLQQRVNAEYSFVETLRHLLFAWDAWLPQIVGRAPHTFHEWALPPDLPTDAANPVAWSAGSGWSPAAAAPDLDEVLEVREGYMARTHDYLASATSDDLDAQGSPPPWAPPKCSVLYCLRVILHEEWWHHLFASRDLDVMLKS